MNPFQLPTDPKAERDEIQSLFKMLEDESAAKTFEEAARFLASREEAAKPLAKGKRRHIDRRLLFPWLLEQPPGTWEALAQAVRAIKEEQRQAFLGCTKGSDEERDTARMKYVNGKRFWQKLKKGIAPRTAAIHIVPNYLAIVKEIERTGLPAARELQPFTMLHSWVVWLERAARQDQSPKLTGTFTTRRSNGQPKDS